MILGPGIGVVGPLWRITTSACRRRVADHATPFDLPGQSLKWTTSPAPLRPTATPTLPHSPTQPRSASETAAAGTSDPSNITASHRRRHQVIWPRRPAVSATTAQGWNRPEGGSSTRVLDPAGNLSTQLSAGAVTSTPPAVSAATARGWNRPEGGSPTQVLDPAGNLSTQLSAAPRNLVEVLHPECAFGAQPTWASALQPAPQRHGAVTRVACRASVEWSPDRPLQQLQLGLQPLQTYENHHRGNPQRQENDYSAV